MTICNKPPNKTAPEKNLEATLEIQCQHARRNGWSWPPHPFQVAAWLLYLLFALVGFGVLVPLLPAQWVPAGYICPGVFFLCHLIVHLTAVSVDPADDGVRAKNYQRPLGMFNRNQHAHVIENRRCHICDVNVSSRSKHCGTCNKCVCGFDHHCMWLNNCVGERNYWLFVNCVVSAILGLLPILLIAFYVFVEFFLNPMRLRTDQHFEGLKNQTDVWFVFLPATPIETQAPAIPALAGVLIVLGLLTVFLLGHLLIFHIYLMWHRMTTYEYIVQQRPSREMKESEKHVESCPSQVRSIQEVGATTSMKLAASPLRMEGQRMEEVTQEEERGRELYWEREGVFEPRRADAKEGSLPASRPKQEMPFYAGSLGYTNPEIQGEESAGLASAKDLPKFCIRGDGADSKLVPFPESPEMQIRIQPQVKKKKKKRKRLPKVPSSVTEEGSQVTAAPWASLPALQPELSVTAGTSSASSSSSLYLPSAVTPPSSHSPIQAAGPPADYHSESAESMDEIPVAQTRLGSNASNGVAKSHLSSSSQHLALPAGRGGKHQNDGPKVQGKNRQSATEQRKDVLELSPQIPAVFVSKSSGEPPFPTSWPVQISSEPPHRKCSSKWHTDDPDLPMWDTSTSTTAA